MRLLKENLKACMRFFNGNPKKKMTSKYTWILDPGHGGMIDGEYQTSGKRSPEFEFGQYFEGVGNRQIVKKLLAKCKEAGILAIDVVDTEEDMPLRERVEKANILHRLHKNCIYVSIHSDAFDKESANGYSVYTSPGETSSDDIAETFIESMTNDFMDHTLRHDNSDGDRDKEAQFYVLKKTMCPAILIENFFMTNMRECRLLMEDEFQDRIVNCHMKSIKRIEQ